MNRRYPWDSLEKPGDSFVWRKLGDERSLRSQANKQGMRRGVVYSVRKVLDKSKPKPIQTLVVSLVNCLL